MPNQSWAGLLNNGGPTFTGAGTALSTATTATLSPQLSSNYDWPIQNGGQPYGWYPGMILRVTARGILTTTTTSTTATLFMAANTTNGTGTTYTTLATVNGITTGTTAITGIQWDIEAITRCTAVASSGNTLSTIMKLTLGNSGAALPANPIALTGTAGIGPLFGPNSAGETAAAVNTAGASPPIGIALRGTLAGANATLQCTQWLIEALN